MQGNFGSWGGGVLGAKPVTSSNTTLSASAARTLVSGKPATAAPPILTVSVGASAPRSTPASTPRQPVAPAPKAPAKPAPSIPVQKSAPPGLAVAAVRAAPVSAPAQQAVQQAAVAATTANKATAAASVLQRAAAQGKASPQAAFQASEQAEQLRQRAIQAQATASAASMATVSVAPRAAQPVRVTAPSPGKTSVLLPKTQNVVPRQPQTDTSVTQPAPPMVRSAFGPPATAPSLAPIPSAGAAPVVGVMPAKPTPSGVAGAQATNAGAGIPITAQAAATVAATTAPQGEPKSGFSTLAWVGLGLTLLRFVL